MQNNIKYRFALMGESPLLLNIQIASILQGLKGTYSSYVLTKWTQTLNAIEYEDAISKKEIYIASFNDQMIGFGQYKRDWKEIKELFIHPNFFKQGIGHKIAYELENIARGEKVTQLRTFSTINSESFYKSIGFKSIQSKYLEIAINLKVQFIEMEKTLC